MDSIRAKFFWQGANDKSKYYMMRWDAVTRPKKFGGLGIINTRIMNDCLLTKWIYKICRDCQDTWCKLLKAEYMPDNDFFSSKVRGTSQFWQGLHKVKHLFQWGAIYKGRNGKRTRFWQEWNHLTQNVTLQDTKDEIEWGLGKSRMFTTRSLYRFLTFRGINNNIISKVWSAKILLK
ncbi:hypothetical protein PR202_ga17095 [Eleusine coracana subsp. coracana]|uniref:Reverse transcriptase n=1 Tax=Eleusine coracana subsp. coracana TaxID=191504 RepID=A0AAV5CNC9_ELECO|nr:hypothetical protein PR202_ga17095 [Eleusine coracana subsp. coracana]